MLRNAFTDHARERCKERYGLDLTDCELHDIVGDCLAGKAILQRTNENKNVYIYERNGVRMIPLINPEDRLLITFLPEHSVVAGARLRHHRQQGNVKQKFATAKGLSFKKYRRENLRCRDVETEE